MGGDHAEEHENHEGSGRGAGVMANEAKGTTCADCPLAVALRQLMVAIMGGEAGGARTRLLSTREAAELLGMSERWMYGAAESLPFTRRIGRTLRFDEHGLREWAAQAPQPRVRGVARGWR